MGRQKCIVDMEMGKNLKRSANGCSFQKQVFLFVFNTTLLILKALLISSFATRLRKFYLSVCGDFLDEISRIKILWQHETSLCE